MPRSMLSGMKPGIGLVLGELEQAGSGGHLGNISMLAFVACRAFKRAWPDAHVSYESNWKIPEGKDLDFAVLTRHEPRMVRVAGMIRPLGNAAEVVEQTIAGFRKICSDPVQSVPCQPPGQQDTARSDYPVAPDCQYILLSIASRSAFESALGLWHEPSMAGEPNRHFACVVQWDDSNAAAEFMCISSELARD